MAEVQMLFPMDPKEFWQKLRTIVEQVVIEHSNRFDAAGGQNIHRGALLKVNEVCSIFRISKPTLYEWMNNGKLPSIKIESRRFFQLEDVEKLIEGSKTKTSVSASSNESIQPKM